MTSSAWLTRADGTPARQGTLLFVGLPAVALAAVFVSLIIPLTGMFLLDEYRQWVLVFRPDHLQSYIQFPQVFDPSGAAAYFNIASSRGMSYWASFAFGAMCGPTPLCHNSFHLIIVLVATACSVLTIRTLALDSSAFPQLVTGAVILISVPVVDALSWQATILDKLAMLFTAVTLFIAASIDVGPLKWLNAFGANVALWLFTFAAYNSKEAAFFLAPAAAMLIGCRALAARAPFGRAVARAFVLMALPLIYACCHVALVLYNRVIVRPEEFSRVTGGDVGLNVEFYARYMLDLHGTGTPLRTVAALTALLSVVVVAAAWMSRRRFPIPLPLWAAIGLLASLVIAVRTASGSPFYLLVPMVYFGLLLGFATDAILAAQKTWLARAAVMVAALVFLGVRAEMIFSVMPWYRELAERSTDFQQTLRTVRSSIAGDLPGRVIFIRTAQDDRAYMLMARDDDNNRALSSYILDAKASAADRRRMDKSIRVVAPGAKQPAPNPNDLAVFLGPTLQLDHMNRTPK